jgi:hypothetical protein
VVLGERLVVLVAGLQQMEQSEQAVNSEPGVAAEVEAAIQQVAATQVMAVQEVCLAAEAEAEVLVVAQMTAVQAQEAKFVCGFTNERHNKRKSSRR